MSTTWLTRQKKGDLAALAHQLDISTDGMLKEDIVGALDLELHSNPAKYSKDPTFADYYGTRSGSPMKRGGTAVSDIMDKPVSRVRRTTQRFKEEMEDADTPETTGRAIVTRTPQALQRVAARVPLPASPADVTNAIERQTTLLQQKARDVWNKSQVTGFVDRVRGGLSKSGSIEVCALLIEAIYLHPETMPTRPLLQIPAIKALGTSPHTFWVPDLFVLLTSSFWTPTLLWMSTTLFLPLLFSYFFSSTYDLSSTRKRLQTPFDPLTFNITKALVSWMVYSQDFRFCGYVSDLDVARINSALPMGSLTFVIAAGIGGITSIYQAALMKK
ncbi:hypothetical protein K402DRAFT_388118 [Aulographum hederae CBS 113979]|uniref:Uncharacterized protein n=1 Tax=Aulographum hederae CBS 113979 TaxID=1176131 RepID=A0A6G1HHF4_9PEZI|nr:hypothetical protein K402DRAFT_388118 [Aulographum hederae CBS 113979]